MAVFRYTVTMANREDHVETGTVVARNEKEAKKKLEGLDLGNARLKRLGGVTGLIKTFTADIK
ncbi:MAG: hypothetical protein JXR94_02265 [Candidatus Hydrogenedentes bacterium]|nr:hypothetical protein [Candidatus Hydrogenedentota bacterium]